MTRSVSSSGWPASDRSASSTASNLASEPDWRFRRENSERHRRAVSIAPGDSISLASASHRGRPALGAGPIVRITSWGRDLATVTRRLASGAPTPSAAATVLRSKPYCSKVERKHGTLDECEITALEVFLSLSNNELGIAQIPHDRLDRFLELRCSRDPSMTVGNLISVGMFRVGPHQYRNLLSVITYAHDQLAAGKSASLVGISRSAIIEASISNGSRSTTVSPRASCSRNSAF